MTGPPPPRSWDRLVPAALGVAAALVLVRSVLLALDRVDRLQVVGLSDPVWPVLGALLALPLTPHVPELQVARAEGRRWEPPQPAGRHGPARVGWGRDGAGLSADGEAELAAGRYVGLQLALADA